MLNGNVYLAIIEHDKLIKCIKLKSKKNCLKIVFYYAAY